MTDAKWKNFVTDLQRDTVVAFGTTINRPPSRTSWDWQALWRGDEREDIAFSFKDAHAFGINIQRPLNVTSAEWFNFWHKRSTRNP